MKKFSGLVATALLAVAGPGHAVTCSYDNVPAATLLVPYFKVSRNGSTGGDVPEGGTDTLIALTNVSNTAVIVHATVWNKYSRAILDWNIPMTAFDVAFFRMKDVLNGKLNSNSNTQSAARLPNDLCGINRNTGAYAPVTGFGATTYIRFRNPDATDIARSISIYDSTRGELPVGGNFRRTVWDSLDESGDIVNFRAPGGVNILDTDNRGCGSAVDGTYSGDFSGYVTLDVVNYCTNWFPDEPQFYTLDAIATSGWSVYGYTPNCLIGDVFYIDPAASGGVIAGDVAVPLEFDYRLDWRVSNTFFGRYDAYEFPSLIAEPGPLHSGSGLNANWPFGYQFIGDGREPLGTRYGLRYYSDTANGLQSWAIVWRTDIYNNPNNGPGDINLCDWWRACAGITGGGCAGFGLFDTLHQLVVRTFDNDEGLFIPTGGGPSGGEITPNNLYVFLESQRISLLNNGEINPGGFKGGWIDIRFPGNTLYNEAYVGVQHSGPGTTLSVGHSASVLSNQFLCSPIIFNQFGNIN